MKRILTIVLGLLALFAAAMTYGVWRESQEPISSPPGPLAMGRAQLHTQLEDAKKLETVVEKQGWNSPADLRRLIQGHEQRIEKLKDNPEAKEILAYDRDAVDRLQKRIAALAEQQAAKAEEQESQAEPKKSQPDAQP
ncbi:MAG TPA: hypothetical protein VGG62_03580 [Terracidiphilus sp.]|jgi:hypothetical protein